jgi:pantoate--beta-alanine ligase
MYPKGSSTSVKVLNLSDDLCGGARPQHFEGVATIVTKLLMQAAPDVAVFGEKDYQQLIVIRSLVRDLFIPVEIVGSPIVREEDGLAISSRNVYLSPKAERAPGSIGSWADRLRSRRGTRLRRRRDRVASSSNRGFASICGVRIPPRSTRCPGPVQVRRGFSRRLSGRRG